MGLNAIGCKECASLGPPAGSGTAGPSCCSEPRDIPGSYRLHSARSKSSSRPTDAGVRTPAGPFRVVKSRDLLGALTSVAPTKLW